jgi:hypothetical protein
MMAPPNELDGLLGRLLWSRSPAADPRLRLWGRLLKIADDRVTVGEVLGSEEGRRFQVSLTEVSIWLCEGVLVPEDLSPRATL